VTGSRQEEVIERIAEEESWRKRKHGKRQRELGGKEKKHCRMNEHACPASSGKYKGKEKKEKRSTCSGGNRENE